MKTTLKTISALAIAAATLTAVSLATGSTASANPFRGGGHGPVILKPIKAPGLSGRLASHLKISCLGCNLPRPHKWGHYPWRFHHWGYFPWRYYGWQHRYDWYRWHYRFGFERRPVGLAAMAAPAAAPVQAAGGSQGCLTEHKMPDGSFVFEDVCKQISAIAPPPSADPRQ